MAKVGASVLCDALASDGLRCRSMDSQPGDAREWLAPALAEVDLVVAVGGDGAARQAASAIADRAVHLWISPSGTENLLARALGMRGGPAALLAAIRARRSTAIDLALAQAEGSSMADGAGDAGAAVNAAAAPGAMTSAGDQRFVLMASCGFDAEVVARLAAVRRGAISHASYLGPIAGSLRGFRPPRVSIEFDGGEVAGIGGAIVANAPRYAFGIDPIRRARLDDGVLDAALLPCRGGFGALVLGARCLLGFRPGSLASPTLRVTTDRPVVWQLDGDPAPWGPVSRVEFGVRHRAVRILLPAPPAPGEFEASLRQSLESPPVEWSLPPFDEEV